MAPEESPAELAYRAMFLETMKPCRELPRHERELKREMDRREQRQIEDRAAEATTIHIGQVA